MFIPAVSAHQPQLALEMDEEVCLDVGWQLSAPISHVEQLVDIDLLVIAF